ncbi:MAG: phage tail tube protein [Psychrilyobacter sp.]|uniref:phage tail tube protein n=1 Tax=Psychrilyobacter sp. TaxID=2586924 RepID=UPI003C72232E
MNSREIFNGAFGDFVMDGEVLAQIKSAEATIENEYESINLPGGKKGQKLKSSEGKGKFVFYKINSFEFKKFLKNNINMKATSFSIEVAIDDPDGNGAERISLAECEFSGNFNLFNFSLDSLIEKEVEFWFDKDLVDTPELA